MPSVSFSVEVSVDDRLNKYRKKNKLDTRTEGIDKLLVKAGF